MHRPANPDPAFAPARLAYRPTDRARVPRATQTPNVMNRARSIVAAVALAALLALPALAQHPEGHAPRAFHHGWYAGPAVEVTTLNGEAAVMSGLRAGWIANHRLSLGFDTYRVVSDVPADRPSADGLANTEFFYSGLSAAYAFPVAPRLSASPTFLLGAAEAHWREDFWDGLTSGWERDEQHTTSLVLEPGVRVEYQVLPWMQATLGAGYRFVTAGKSGVLEQGAMGGPGGALGLRFGRF
jgi:hypothetical protein